MKLKANEGVRGVAVGGAEYLNDDAGFVDVPDEFVPAVLGAGYTMPPVVAEVVAPAAQADEQHVDAKAE